MLEENNKINKLGEKSNDQTNFIDLKKDEQTSENQNEGSGLETLKKEAEIEDVNKKKSLWGGARDNAGRKLGGFNKSTLEKKAVLQEKQS